MAIVDVVCNAAGISWTCLYDAHISRKGDRQESWHTHHFLHMGGSAYALVHCYIGQHINVVAVNTRSFHNLKHFEVAAQCCLRQLEPLLTQCAEQLLLTSHCAARYYHSECVEPVVSRLVHCIFIHLWLQRYTYLCKYASFCRIFFHNRCNIP